MRKPNKAILSLILTTLLVSSSSENVYATPLITTKTSDSISSSTTKIAAMVDSIYVMVNNKTMVLDTPAVLIQNKVFIPVKNAAGYFGVDFAWNAKLKVIEMKTAQAAIQFDLTKKTIRTNGITLPFKDTAVLVKGRLLVSLEWFADNTGTKQTYNAKTKLFTLEFVNAPIAIIDTMTNAQPIAKFTFSKPSYRIGETIRYTDLSYDPDAEGLRYEWTGKQDAFFTPGIYPITLKVFDKAGSESAAYTRSVVIEDQLYLSEVEYPVYNQPIGTSFKTDWNWVWNHYTNLPLINKQIIEDPSRTLLVSDSPEIIHDYGILYQDTINGKARLYADHMNGTTEKVRFSIIVKNTSDQPITLQTTNKGEVTPSVYANLIGHVASVDFLLHDPSYIAPLVVPAGQTLVYVQMPDFYPDQGVNLIYDVESDGPLEVSFVAGSVDMPPLQSFETYKPLAFDRHIRGTFPGADKTWNIDLSSLAEVSRMTIGDGKEDAYVKGYDTQRQIDVFDMGNYGVVYKIHADKPRKMAVMLVAKGGPFKGPFLINGQFVMAPASGVITAFQSMLILARTTGTENSFDLEFTPPAGSAFPIDLIFYPLEDLKP
jgi:hypothetical protein